jgi:hypothetical protein
MSDIAIEKPTRSVALLVHTSLALLFSLLWAGAFVAAKFGLRSSPPLLLISLQPPASHWAFIWCYARSDKTIDD